MHEGDFSLIYSILAQTFRTSHCFEIYDRGEGKTGHATGSVNVATLSGNQPYTCVCVCVCVRAPRAHIHICPPACARKAHDCARATADAVWTPMPPTRSGRGCVAMGRAGGCEVWSEGRQAEGVVLGTIEEVVCGVHTHTHTQEVADIDKQVPLSLALPKSQVSPILTASADSGTATGWAARGFCQGPARGVSFGQTAVLSSIWL